MPDVSAARRWAQALDALAVEAGNADAVLSDLTKVATAVSGEGAPLMQALQSPLFTVAERKAVLGDVLTRLKVKGVVSSFLHLLVDRGRFGALPAIVDEATRLSDARAGRVRVQVTTVDPLSEDLHAALAAAFSKATGKAVVLEPSTDPTLIGGLVARVGSRVYDASLRTRLEDLKNRLIHTAALPEA